MMKATFYKQRIHNNFQTSKFTYAGQPNKKMDIPNEKLDCPDNLKGLDNSGHLKIRNFLLNVSG